MPLALVIILAAAAISAIAWIGLRAFFRRPAFGALPEGERLARVRRSPNWRDGEFKNIEPTPARPPNVGRFEPALAALRPHPRLRPVGILPSVKTDLAALPDERLVWFGHSSFLLTLGGLRLLFDPVLSRRASPVPMVTRAFRLASELSASDIPAVDCLLVSHDHWDHLDYPTIMALKGRTASMVVPLGVGAHLERWGVEGFLEGDWGESFQPLKGLTVHLVPARHFGGRSLVWSRSLWTGFVIEAGGRRVYYSGDGGYGGHFRAAGERFGGFDLAILECGQYDRLWPLVHMTPEQTVQAAADARARAVMPVHCGRFCVCRHPWDEPLIRFAKAATSASPGPGTPIRAVTPLIGEPVAPFDETISYGRWWEGLK